CRGWGVRVLQGARERVEVLQFSPDGWTLVARCLDGVQVWHGFAAVEPANVLGHRGSQVAGFTHDGQRLVVGGSRMAGYDRPTGQATEIPSGMASPGGVCGLTPDGQFVVVAGGFHRLSCRPLAELSSPVWSAEGTRPPYTPPLFLAGGERFVVFEWR